jgi:Phospholipase_D-nuclease N-terminal
MAKQKWSDLSPSTRRLICVAGAAEAILTATALRDIARRPGDQVRGPKVAWVLSFVVQPFGPLAYFGFGRR